MADIQKRKKKDGKISYTARIRVKGYPTISASFERLTDARSWAAEKESMMKRGRKIKEIESRKHTLAELIDRYIEYELPKRKSDHKKFQTHLSWWKNKIGAYLLSDITSSLLSQCKDELSKEPSPKFKLDSKGNRVETYRSPATVNRYIATLSIVLSKAYKEWEWLEENPMSKVAKFKENRGRTRFLSEEEQTSLLLACKEMSNPLIYLLVVLALSTGARLGELLSLTWDNVNLNSDEPMLYFMETKNGENRAVPLTGYALELLKEHSKIRKLNSKLVFARNDGTKPADLRWQWEKALEKSGIKNFRFHDLRHTAASNLAMNGASLLEIGEILGHKTQAMTKRYSHLTKKYTASVLERANKAMFKNISF